MKTLCLFAVCCVLLAGPSFSQADLGDCADQFIGSDTANAPTLFDSSPSDPFGNNIHLCYRDDNVSFFALEYWPDQFTPRWASYRIEPSNYGPNGCSTFTRGKHNCYAKSDVFTSCASNPGDPFHKDHMLVHPKLSANPFSNTGHDRGHIAPRQVFSWHVCGNYQTFSLANMSPQRGFLNQRLWRELEKQVLTWGVDEGPIFVTTGTIFTDFPHQRFEVYSLGDLDAEQVYKNQATMAETVAQHTANFEATSTDEMLRPMRKGNLANVKTEARNLRMPTGYFKVIFRPAVDTEPAHAIAFMIPHTFENLNLVANNFSNLTTAEAFWVFVSRIDLIEETSGISFPGIPKNMKSTWGDDFFFAHDTSRNIRDNSCGDGGTPQGVLENSTADERIAACIDHLN